MRLTGQYEQPAGRQPLLACELCGTSAADVTCVPSVVSGEVIGAVHIEHERPLEPRERDRVEATVTQSAPVLANLRNLAVAEARAATDALTGLANKRACHDTLKRMVAHAGRTLSPLSAIVLDLDHFKQINDRYGHELAEKLRGAIAAIDPAGVDREITASIGIASYPADAVDGDGLVRMADRALYAAKRAGRNRVELAESDLTPGLPSRA